MTPHNRAALEFLLDNLVWVLLIVVLAAFSLFVPHFFQIGIFANIVEQSTFVGVMAIGLALVVIAGHMDLSVESVAALSAMVTGILFCSGGIGWGWTVSPDWLLIPISLFLALAVGAVIGTVNGLLVVKVRMNAFIVTLASYIWVRGLVVAISGGRSAQDLAPAIRIIGIQTILYIPLIAWIAIACFAVFTFILAKTPFGRHLTMIGGNEAAVYRAGIKVDRVLMIAFVLAGAISGLAGWLLAIRTSGATANLGTGMLFNAFAAVVIGGVSLKGGVGQLPGVYAGVLLLSSIHTAINLMGLPANYTQVILGVLVLAAVLLDTVKIAIRQRLA
ncbi:ABC transporter permease [Youhaiella tibetensis]|uniref:Autoinducer 2 import system permease protein LsrD n=1 Tax=Paradevosia tibetensis TaxID=1447062 RepID=A0A5B9DVL4_9HYPH|nr:ABC transporter permease [Youhaiella tibetensis]AKR57538.1 ABC transporter permease [Devosia sp. H5989]QEE22468.1 ABC transporter permease [Youhaiella tibetensis]GGF42016.1 ABC transporter permease [Youhaiella tibetensis]